MFRSEVRTGRSGEARPLAEVMGRNSAGLDCGVILWGHDGRVTGLEVYEGEPSSAAELPAVETLTSAWNG